MIRAFAALALPEALRFDLMLVQSGLPLPRPVPPENLHLTLVFLGEVAGPTLADVDAAFSKVRVPPFELALSGLGMFGGARARSVHAEAVPCAPMLQLQAKLETAARSAGVAVPGRRFAPHVTLGRVPERFAERPRLEAAVAARGGYRSAPVLVEDYRLFQSWLGPVGSTYAELATYALG
ncbi:MAG: RNA 2',3'-cyclic phosphodiesterase [Amaricoccus sp.]|uniref:RNA 2',3'-cyclic phosphodiesterase n=1 Tax=Amaricoccus sp. TaxID=1872485 RepID=UPI0039E5B6B3